MIGPILFTCEFVGCEEAATGRYLPAEHNREVVFGVRSAPFTRITSGERPVIVAEQLDRPENDGRPALLLE